MNNELPETWSLWRHKSGRIYRVMSLANMTATKPGYPKTVVYECVTSGEIYTKPLDKWHESMTRF